jgi:7,8-dihydroneopterin aldolase/epimerase/oxygenase
VTTTIELRGITLHGRHGVEAEERERGQRFVFDVWIDVDDSALSDRIEDAVDYREVADAVREVSDGHTYTLLEALADAVARTLLDRFPVDRARVRVRKPEVKLDVPVEWSAATAERWRS